MSAMLDKFDRLVTVKGLLSIWLAFLLLLPSFRVGVGAAPAKIKGVDYEKPVVVSMGDSFSAGEGIEKFYDQDLSNGKKVQSKDWLAHRSQNSWPGMLEFPGLDDKTREYKGTNWFFVAASGAETKHFKYDQIKEYSRWGYEDSDKLPPQLDIFKQLEPNSVDYVTLTIGGNDAGFSDIITEAVMGSKTNRYLFVSQLSDMLSKTWTDFYKEDGIRDDLYDCYKDIEEAAGAQAQIIVAGYPKLLDPYGKDLAISVEESLEINRAVSNFNMAIERLVEHCAAEGMKICFVSVEEAFDGHGAYASDAYIHGVYLLQTKGEDLKSLNKASAYSMHPNYDGAIEYAKCVNDKIEELAKEEEEHLEQEALNPSDKDREIVLVLDASGSMSGTPLAETKTAAHEFVKTVLEAEANIGVVYYDESAYISSALSDSRDYLDKAIDYIGAGGGTNIEAGLKMADNMLQDSNADKKIIVLMSDGEPNAGKVGQDLIDYAEKLKEEGYYIYTLGFFSGVSYKTDAQMLMDGIASEGCHYEVTDADSLVFFFGDIADQISGEKFIYVRIACPVDVTVTYDGEKMTSKGNYSSVRTSYGSMTFEENEVAERDEVDTAPGATGLLGGLGGSSGSDNGTDGDADSDTRIKILRLKEGADYDIKIEGNGSGKMDYTIGFVDEDGEYSDIRRFTNVKITKRTEIDTVATVSSKTDMYVDEDGDGKYDLTYRAFENSKAEIVDYTYVIYIVVAAVLAIAIAVLILVTVRYFKIRRYL